MSMLGIDLGNWSCHLIYAEACPRETDGFSRYWSGQVKTQISQIKCLLGRKFSDPELQLELDYVPFRVTEGPDGYPLVHGRCKGEDRSFNPVEILAMLISSAQFLASDRCGDDSPYRCIGIPMYFTDQQKQDMLQAAQIAGFPASLCLRDETTAMLVAFEKNHLMRPEGIVAFIDIGHASMQVCFAKLNRHSPTVVLYKGYARSLGGREFDKVLFKHFASKIRKEYNIDVSESSSACVRLKEACESLKNDLSENNEASFSIEKFSGSIDIKGSITREQFESLSISILEKIEVALNRAVTESRLNGEKIDFFEAVGKGCSIPVIIDILTRVLGEKLSTNRTYYEYVARGCAMQENKLDMTGTNIMINDLTTGLETSEKVSENFLWRRAMDKDGHLLTFVNDFLEMNMHPTIFKADNFDVYSYSELQHATNNFRESSKLGESVFGALYMGILRKTTVAIKILNKGSSQGAKEFHQEVEILSKVQHPNLVKLIGACAGTPAIIYEYVPNGSLEDRLRCKNNTLPLSWQERVRIASEICSALSFLHCSKPHGIVHGDLKPDNILLDGNNTSKICSFGLSRELEWTKSASIPYHFTDRAKGTLAYMDPEYLSEGKVTPRYDVYSFGIMLLWLVTCKDPWGIRNLVEKAQKKGTLEALIDASAGPWPLKEAEKMISLGLRCSDPMRSNRPDLSTKVLKEITSMLQVASASKSSWVAYFFVRVFQSTGLNRLASSFY